MGVVRNGRIRRERGMAMVEMVFVLPVLLMVVFAIAEFGLMFNRWLTLSNAVREGARVGVVFRSPCNAADVQIDVNNAVNAYLAAGGISGVTPTLSGECDTNNPLIVSATYNYNVKIPFASLGTVPLAYSSRMRNEQ